MDNEQIDGKKAFALILGKEVNGLVDRLNIAAAAFLAMKGRGDMDETLSRAQFNLVCAGVSMVEACEEINSFVMSYDEEDASGHDD